MFFAYTYSNLQITIRVTNSTAYRERISLKYSLKNKYLLSISFVIFFFLLYFIKIQIGINIFDSISFGSYPPFKYLTDNVIDSTRPGLILSEDFDTIKLSRTFNSKLWMREKGTVSKEFSQNGFNDSRCILVTNSSSGSWVSSQRKFVKVSKGDQFYMEGLIKITGEDSRAFLSVSSFDSKKDVISYDLLRTKIDRKGGWVKHKKYFSIPDDNIKFIRLRLGGIGKGKYLFDNIIFRKINSSEQ